MNKLDNYRRMIRELSDELNHCIEQYNSLILKEERSEKNNPMNIEEEERRKSPQKEPCS